VLGLDNSCRVDQALCRDAIVATVSSARRAEAHAAVGRALLELAGGPTVRDLSDVGGAARLAAHFLAAGPSAPAEALEYSILAGQEATTRLGHGDAAEHYENALGLLPAGAAGRGELILALAGARDRAGDPHAARAAYRRVGELAHMDGNATTLARAA